jgi:succinyl-CoA synthetase beta subunit
MKIHEYQAKALFREAGIAVLRGNVATSAREVEGIGKELGAPVLVVKAQIHAGGRGKGGGVKLTRSPAEAAQVAAGLLGKPLVTPQTGPAGQIVRKVFVEEGCAIARELYVAIVLDRERSTPVIMASAEGGMDIEELAANHPDKIVREAFFPELGLQPFQARRMAFALGLGPPLLSPAVKTFLALARIFREKDCSLVEINPLVVTEDDRLIALDGKIDFDSSGLFRHPEIAALRDLDEEDEKERKAADHGLAYIRLDGNIGCMVNGAGLAMATMDLIKICGGEPANFLDVGGGATKEKVTEAFKILLSDPKVKAVLVNIFGGIMKCDVIAEGVIAAVKDVGISVPLVVRLEGTNVEKGRSLLQESKLAIKTAPDMVTAAKLAVEAASGA